MEIASLEHHSRSKLNGDKGDSRAVKKEPLLQLLKESDNSFLGSLMSILCKINDKC